MRKKSSVLILAISFVCFFSSFSNVLAQVDVDTCQTLLGEGEHYYLTKDIIHPGSGDCLKVGDDSITIDCAGFSIYNYSLTGDVEPANRKSAIFSNKTNTKIYNCNISLSDERQIFGIYFENTDYGHVLNNTISYTWAGVMLNNTNNTVVENNTFHECDDEDDSSGLRIYYSDDNEIHNNIMIRNQNGALLTGSRNNNMTFNNITDGTTGYLIENSNSNWISYSNTFNNMEKGSYLYHSSLNTLQYNNFSGNSQEDFFIDGINTAHFDNTIESNNVINYSYYIYYKYGEMDRNFDSGNLPNAGVFYCMGCINVNVSDINLDPGRMSGIYFWSTNNSKIENVTTISANDAFMLKQSHNVMIKDVVSSYNYYGIYTSRSSGIDISGFVSNGDTRGLWLSTDTQSSTVTDFSINGSGTDGVRLGSTASNNVFTDGVITNSGAEDVDLSSSSINNTFINVSYSLGNEDVTGGSELKRKWYFRGEVLETDGDPAGSALVEVYNTTNSLVNLTTNSTGWTPKAIFTEYRNVAGSRTYYSNLTMNVSGSDYFTNNGNYNLTIVQNNINYQIVLSLGYYYFLHQTMTGNDHTLSIALGDLNGDGYLDFIEGNDNQVNSIMINDGTGTFSTLENSSESDNTRSVAIGDIDNDGDKDYIAGNNNEPNRVYLNNGTGHFSLFQNSTLSGNEPTFSVVLSDIDNDGDLDYIEGNSGSGNEIQVFVNNGSGNFSIYQYFNDDSIDDLAVGDLNGDNYPDIVAVRGLNSVKTRIYFNNGSGYFFLNSTLDDETYYTYAVSVADIDNDEDLDIITGNGNTPTAQKNGVFMNLGNGSFIMLSDFGDYETNAIALADIDHDGDIDFIGGNDAENNNIYLNNGTGKFSRFENESQSGETRALAIGDLDNDGDLDYISGNYNNGKNHVYLNRLNDTKFILVTIKGTSAFVNDDGVGTKVILGSGGNGYREVSAGDTSQNGNNIVHFGTTISGFQTLNATFISGKNISCTVQQGVNFTLYENGSSTNGISCVVNNVAPVIVLMLPPKSYLTRDIDINFSCSVEDYEQLKNISITIWNSTGYVFYSNSQPLSGTSQTPYWYRSAINPGAYKWNCMVCDSGDKCVEQSANYSFSVVLRNSLYVKLIFNNTDNLVHVPGQAILNSSTMSDTEYSNLPHYYLVSYIGNIVTGIVISDWIPRYLEVGNNESNHFIAVSDDLDKSRILLLHSLGDWNVVENRIERIESGNFFTSILPSFSYGLGSSYLVELALGYSDIDLQGIMGMQKGTHKIVIESNGTKNGKPSVIITKE